jgi:uncharacterized protein
MQYRTLGKTNVTVSALGFGAMRLPTLGSEERVDEPATGDLLRYAIDHGVNYVDTAYVYHGGQGEGAVGRALSGGYREQVHLATKLPVWSVQSLADCDRIFDEQRTRLRTDRIDCYLLHCLTAKSWFTMRALGVLNWAERQRAAGRIGHIGFSFHDRYEAFVEIVDGYDWDFCQIQYNYVCHDVQAGTRGLKYAASKGLGVIVMEPLFGGSLASPPPAVQRIWDEAPERCRPVDVALRWVWNEPGVSLVLSGMNALTQLQENLASADRSAVGSLTSAEAALIVKAQRAYQRLTPIPCTKCGYCLPCPHGVNIPDNLELFNQATVFPGRSAVLCRNLYLLLPEDQRASACAGCGTCEERCPQQIPIRQELARVQEQFR